MGKKNSGNVWEKLMKTIETTAERKLAEEEKIKEKTEERYWYHKKQPGYFKGRKKEVKTKVGIKFLKEIIFDKGIAMEFRERALVSFIFEFEGRRLGQKIPRELEAYFFMLIKKLLTTKVFWHPFDLTIEQMSLLPEGEARQFFDLLDVKNPFFWRGSVDVHGWDDAREDTLQDSSDTDTHLMNLISSEKISDYWKKKVIEKFHQVIIEDEKKGGRENWYETPLAYFEQLLYRSTHVDDLAAYFNKERNFEREIEFLLENFPDSKMIFRNCYELELVLGKIKDRKLALSFFKHRFSKNKKDDDVYLSDKLRRKLKELFQEFPDDKELKGIIERQESIGEEQETRSKEAEIEARKKEKLKEQKISQAKNNIGKIEKEATVRVEELLTGMKKVN